MTNDFLNDLDILSNNMGYNSNIVSKLFSKYGSQLIGKTNSQNIPLITKAIQNNDGEAVSFFLEHGENLNQPSFLNSTKTVYEYAKEVATYENREPFAWNAISTFKEMKDSCHFNILSTTDLKKLDTPNYNNDIIKIYHGAKAATNEHSLNYLLNNIIPTGIKEISNTPTLSTIPLGQFFSPGTIGFCYDVPKHLISFDKEQNPNAVLHIDTEHNIARILTDNKTLLFKDFKAEIYYRPEYISKKVYSTYSHSQQKDEGNYDRICSTFSKTELLLMKEIKETLMNSYQALSLDSKEKEENGEKEEHNKLKEKPSEFITPSVQSINEKMNKIREKLNPKTIKHITSSI